MKKISKKEYKKLFEKAEFKTFFHKTEWHEFLEKEFKWLKFEHYLYKNDFLITFGRVNDRLISLPFCEYGGPLPLKENTNFNEFQKDILREFKNVKIKLHPQILNISTNPAVAGDQPSEAINHQSVSTHWIDLKDKSEENLLGSFRKTLRHSIRNAQNNNLEIKKTSGEQDLRKFYDLYIANLKRKKTVPYPFSVIKFLYNNPVSELLLAKHKDKIIAGDMFLHYDKFIHYFLSASNYKYRNLGANYLILWEKIKALCKTDKIFDFGAAPKGSTLETFKRGWRGKEYPILQIGTKRTPAYAKASAGREESLRYSKVRDIWGLLPVFVIKKISRYFVKYRL